MDKRIAWKCLRATASAWVVLSTVLLPGCTSSGSHQTTDLHTPLGDIVIKTQSGQYHIKIGAGQHGKLTFKDKDGKVIPGGIEVDGPIDDDFPLPAGYASYDYTVTDKKTTAPKALQPIPRSLDTWVVNCTTNYLNDATLHGFTYEISTKADSEATAWARFHSVMAGGPGGAVPAGVQVDAWVDVQAGVTTTTVKSALRDTFSSYSITVNGAIVADLASGTNAVVSTLGNGWVSITSVLPNSIAGSGATVQLHQAGTAPGNVTSDIELGGL